MKKRVKREKALIRERERERARRKLIEREKEKERERQTDRHKDWPYNYFKKLQKCSFLGEQ